MSTLYTPDLSTPVSRPLYMTAIEAGFPSPADDYNDQYTPIEITPDMAFEIWGVVTNVIHKV